MPKEDKNKIQEYYLSIQIHSDNFWAGLRDEKVTNCDIKDIVWYLELSQNTYMQNYIEPAWHRVMYELLLEKLEKCNVLFFPIISSSEFHYTLLAFHKLEQKWRHYNPLKSLGSRKEERSLTLLIKFTNTNCNAVNVVEGCLEYVKPKVKAFLESRTIAKLVKKRDEPPTPVAKEMSTNEELTLNWNKT
ncbi:unnamed protein product [Prunus armeniaca]